MHDTFRGTDQGSGFESRLAHGGRLIAGAFAAAVALGAQAQPSPAPPVQARTLTELVSQLSAAVAAAERACVAGSTNVQTQTLRVKFDQLLKGVSAAVNLETQTSQLRGAVGQLPALVQSVENDKIRNCISGKVDQIYSLALQEYRQFSPAARWPNPIQFRFSYTRGRDASRIYSGMLRLDVAEQAISDRLALQDPNGLAYFADRLPYPEQGQPMRGTIVAERGDDSRLTRDRPAITRVCIEQPRVLPSLSSIRHEMFDCAEGGSCRPSAQATGWLTACANEPGGAAAHSPRVRVAGLMPVAAETSATPGLHWAVPSLPALVERNVEGVGYTIFSIDTDAFREIKPRAVEVDIRVNGVPVYEDGLPPDLRPVASEPERFVHRFALQTLDFEGARGGCDAITVTLRPRLPAGGKGAERTANLTYVALRDVAPRKASFGDGQLSWSASYITPRREWRHIAEVRSYIYRADDAKAKDAQVAAADRDKRWLDAQGLQFDGKRVVGVIRPPRTLQPDGTAAFGLAAGLIQDNGQVRFTFPEGDARKLAQFMIDQRARSPQAKLAIDPRPYIFQAVGGSRTVKGVCEEAVVLAR